MNSSPLDPAWLTAHAPGWGLVLARVAGLCLTAPTFAAPGLDHRARLLLALALGAALIPVLDPAIGAAATGPAVVWAGLIELLVGALLGLSAGLIVAAARQAGELVALQAGLSVSALFDPETGAEHTPLGHLYGLLAITAFLALDGPIVLVEALVESYAVVPAGGMPLTEARAAQAFAQVGAALALALRLAAPPAVALVLAGIVMSWIGRLAPAVPILSLSLPLRSFLGLVLVGLSLATLAAALSSAWQSWPRLL